MDPQTPSGNGAQPRPDRSNVTERVVHLSESAQQLVSDARGAVTEILTSSGERS